MRLGPGLGPSPSLALSLAIAAVLGLVLAAAGCSARAKRSVSLYEAGDYAGAARAADDGLAAHPGDHGLWQMRIRAALALGDADGVAKAYAEYRRHYGTDDEELLRDLAAATLRQALGSPSAKLKLVAIEAVASAELQDLADLVAERMGDDDDRVAAAAAVAILRAYHQAPQVADQMLHSEDAEARRIAVEGIGKKVGALALADLRKAADDPDPRVRRAAIRWLGQLKDKSPETAAMLERQLRHQDEGVRAAAAVAAGRIGTGNLAAIAQRALADHALSVRLAAVDLLRAAKRTAELSALAEDGDPTVALEASLALSDRARAAKALERAAAAEKWPIRAGALNNAVRVSGKQAAAALALKLAKDPELGVRLAAARVLAYAGERAAATELFVAALATESALSAAGDLARLGDERGMKALEAAVRDRTHGADARASAVAAHLSARRVTPGLVAALADPSGVVRVEAAAALVMLAKQM